MKHVSIIILLLIATCICSAQELSNRSIEALQYLYPGGSYSYTMMPRDNPILGYKTFYVDANNVLHSESKINVNGRNINNDDLYQFVVEGGNIVSYQHRHFKGIYNKWTVSNDKIFLFSLPDEGLVNEWEETDGNTIYECSSQYTYLKYDGRYDKAVKFVKSCKGNNDISFWIKNRGRIASFSGNSKDGYKLTELLIPYDKVEEVREDVYLEMKKKEAIANFEASLKNHPKSNFKAAYPEVYEELCAIADSIMFTDYKKYIFDRNNAEIKINISAEGKVSAILTYNDMGEYRKQIKPIEDVIKQKLVENLISIPSERESTYGVEARIPMSCTIKYGLVKKSETFNVQYVKKKWIRDIGTAIPDEFAEVIYGRANEVLKECPKKKKQTIQIEYVKHRDRLVFL